MSRARRILRAVLRWGVAPVLPLVFLLVGFRYFWNTMTEEIEQGRKLAEARIKEQGNGETSR